MDLMYLLSIAGLVFGLGLILLAEALHLAYARQPALTDNEYRAYLDLLMCTDPWPPTVKAAPLVLLANFEAVKRGYSDWIEAYHEVTDVLS